VNGVTENATLAWIVFVAIGGIGLAKGEAIARFTGGG
jgi:hypothetical protein